MKKVKQMLSNQKGLTLVELLAVIVILGIIAAIAVPSIGSIIDNSKEDAHEANAEMLISAARMGVASNLYDDTYGGDGVVSEDQLVTDGFLESEITDPDGGDYNSATVTISKQGTNLVYTVNLDGQERDLSGTSGNFTIE